MALTVYRYRAQGPAPADLSKEVPGTVSFTAAGYLYVDITVDSTNLQDLSDAMLIRGWVYDSTAPATTPAQQAAANGVDAISFLLAGSLVAKQPSINFVSGATVVNNGGANRVDVTIPAGTALTAVTPTALTAAAGAVGVGTAAAREDHTHQVTTAAPSDIGNANSAGASTSLVRADHVHNLPFSAVNTALAAATADIAINSHKITGVTDPTNPQDAATKAYVDATAQGLDVKGSVRVISTTNITLTAPQTIDGVSVIAGDRVLVAGQTTASQNGIYVCAAGAWARSADAATSAMVTPGLFTFVEEGTTFQDSGWVLTTNAPIVLNTTSLTFTQFSGAGTVVAGAGLTKTGNTIDVIALDGSIVVAADSITVGVISDTQHGNRGGGALHANVVAAGAAGFMTGADKTKLDGIPTTPANDMILFGDNSLGTSTTTRYLDPGFDSGNAPVVARQFRVTRAGTIKNLRVHCNTAGVGASTLTFTVRKNSVAQTVTCNFSNTVVDGSDTSNNFTVAAGDLLDISVAKTAGITTSPVDIIASVEYAP